MSDPAAKYITVQLEERLHQGEILEGVIQVRQSLPTIAGDGPPELTEMVHPFAIVMTEDCDLEQDFNARSVQAQSPLANILFCEAITTAGLKGRVPPGKDIWKRIIQNKDERYQCIEEVPPGQDLGNEGIPPLGCDFKRYFTVPVDEVYLRIRLARSGRLVWSTPGIHTAEGVALFNPPQGTVFPTGSRRRVGDWRVSPYDIR